MASSHILILASVDTQVVDTRYHIGTTHPLAIATAIVAPRDLGDTSVIRMTEVVFEAERAAILSEGCAMDGVVWAQGLFRGLNTLISWPVKIRSPSRENRL